MTSQLPERFKGSISEGTLNPRDLIPTYVGVLAQANPKHSLVEEFRYAEQAVANLAVWLDVAHTFVYDQLGFWEDEHTGYFMESLFDALCEVAPEGTHFGASEGDGASLGFWDDELEQEHCDVCGRPTPLGQQSQPGDPAWDGYCSAECRAKSERDAEQANA